MRVLGRFTYSIVFLFGIIFSVVLCEENVSTAETTEKDAEETEAVVVLTQSNFDTFLEENELVLVKFYAPWCGHCKTLAPEYEKAAKKLSEDGSKVRLGKVDATVEGPLGERFGIRGYPTLKFFRSGEAEEYSGGRSAETIIEWISLMTSPTIIEVADNEACEKKIADEKILTAFIGTFPAKEGKEYEAFDKVAQTSRKLGRFLAIVKADSKVSVKVKRVDEGEVVAPEVTEEALKKFVTNESLPYFGPINGENFQQYHEKDREMAWFCGSAEEYEAVKPAMREAAKAQREAYSVVWLDTEGYQAHAEKALGITEFPGLVLQTKNGRFIYPDLKTSVKGSEVLQFIDDVKNNRIEKKLKSEEVPTSNKEPVKIVVGKTMEESVYQKDKDVYFMVYAPWCGHCKKLAPIYDEFAKANVDNERIFISKMDATLNESPISGFEWSGYPTLFYIKAGEKKPTVYDGERTLDGFTEHYKLNGTPFTAFANTGGSEEL